MTVDTIALATEDALSEAVGRRLIAESPLASAHVFAHRRNGFGYLRSQMGSWREMAGWQVVLLVTDLDTFECPLALIQDWAGQRQRLPDHLLLRVAVREIESWVLTDHEAIRRLIGKKGKLPPEPDLLPDPKQYLLRLASGAPRDVRDDLVGRKGRDAAASQGTGYNARLTEWVRMEWSPERAAERSPSLARARRALARLAK